MSGISRSKLLEGRPVVGAVLMWFACVPTALAQEQMPVTVVVARQSAVTEQIPVVGSLAAREEIEVRPFIQGQMIETILVETGQHVEKGQALAGLDTTEARMLLDKNSVSILRAKAAVAVEASKLDVASVTEAETRKTLERSRALQPKGAVSQQLLDEHQNAHSRALAELGLARQSLALAEADGQIIAREREEIELTIARSMVRAPQAGLVLRRAARIGAVTSSSAAPLFVIAKDGLIEFVAQVTETSFVRLHEGMRASIVLAGHAASVGGTLRLNAAELDPATRSGEVRIELDAVEGLKPGVFARGSINASTRHNILLPGSAVKTIGGFNSVFVVKGGVVGIRQVSVGARQDGSVEIVNGVFDGEMVVLKSAGFLKAEEKVQPVIVRMDRPAENELAASLRAPQPTGAVQR
jgi:RND family efflux transporter MFP subunit